jgi:hypothetical protein
MGGSEQRELAVDRQGINSVPDDFFFETLAKSRGRETLRLRFVRDSDVRLDIPLAPATVVDLVRALMIFQGMSSEDLVAAIAEFEQKGLAVLKD